MIESKRLPEDRVNRKGEQLRGQREKEINWKDKKQKATRRQGKQKKRTNDKSCQKMLPAERVNRKGDQLKR